MDALEHLGRRVVSAQGVIYHLCNRSLGPVAPYLAFINHALLQLALQTYKQVLRMRLVYLVSVNINISLLSAMPFSGGSARNYDKQWRSYSETKIHLTFLLKS